MKLFHNNRTECSANDGIQIDRIKIYKEIMNAARKYGFNNNGIKLVGILMKWNWIKWNILFNIHTAMWISH